jgi:hypothetical protein
VPSFQQLPEIAAVAIPTHAFSITIVRDKYATMKVFMLLPLSMTWASAQDATNMDPSSHHRQHLMKESSCTLVEMVVSKGDEEDEHSWVCELSKEESSIIHADFVDIDHSNPDVANIIAHAKSGETVLKFQEAVVRTEAGREPLIHFTESALVQETTLVENISASVMGGLSFTSIEERTRNANEAPSTFGTLTALMVRVTDQNGRVNDRNKTQLHDNLYQGVSLATQTEACSHGQLTIEPFAGTMPSGLQITDGVVELTADALDITDGDSANGISGPIFQAAEQAFGAGYREMVDLMLFCLPATGRFVAFAYGSRGFSWYAGSMCSSPTAQLHEVGHNYGLGHSGRINVDGSERKYGDITGAMGGSNSNENQMTCYNPHKSWFLGWYQDQTASIDPLDGIGTREILLNGVADYGKNNEAIVSLRLTTPASQEQDYYVGFNYAEGINKDTRDEKNKITVAYASKGSKGQSWRVAALLPGEWHEIEDFDGSGSTVTVVYYGHTYAGDAKDATVQIIDGPMPPPPSEDDCGSTVTVAIKTDAYPGDVSWYIFEAGRHIAGKTSFDEKWTEYNTTVCMPNKIDDQEYVFEVYDSDGDGLCCTQGKEGNGFEVYDNQGNVWADYLNVNYQYSFSTHSIIVPGSSTKSPSGSPTVSQSEPPSESPSDSSTDCVDSPFKAYNKRKWTDCGAFGCTKKKEWSHCKLFCDKCEKCVDSGSKFKFRSPDTNKNIKKTCKQIRNKFPQYCQSVSGIAETCPKTCGLC